MRLPLHGAMPSKLCWILPLYFYIPNIGNRILHYKQAGITFRFFLLLCVAFPYFRHFPPLYCRASALLFISIRYLTDNTIKVNKIPIRIIPDSLKLRRKFNSIGGKLVIIANCRPRYIFHASVRSCNGSVICGKRNHFILLIKCKDTACRLSFVTDCRLYFKITYFFKIDIVL